jgi:hypothetical protein
LPDAGGTSDTAAATTTTARQVVSVVTEPISVSATPRTPPGDGSSTPLLLISVAFAVLVMVATAALRTHLRKGQPDSGV